MTDEGTRGQRQSQGQGQHQDEPPGADQAGRSLFYGELAAWWPLISPVEDYAEEAAFAVGLLRSASIAVREVLELGSGGGNNAYFLKSHFAMTLVDLSPQMLEVSSRLNPECAHVQGDMRSVRLGREFDAIFVHDAVDYMTSESQLREAMETALIHCRRGGSAVFIPDATRETFEMSAEIGGQDGADGRAVRFMEWTWDPDPDDTASRTEYAFVLRDRAGDVRFLHETHRTGLFGRDEWLRLLADVGFQASAVTEQTTEDRRPREVFVGIRPLS